MAPISLPHLPRHLISTYLPSAPSLPSISKRWTQLPSVALLRRQNPQVILPQTYVGVNSDPSATTVVGIVLGVVLGSLALVIIIWWALWQNSGGETSAASEVIEIGGRRHSRSPTRRHSHSGRRSTEFVEVRRSDRSPRQRSYSPRRSGRIVEERVVEERVRVPRRSFAEEVIVEPRRSREVYEDDVSSVTESDRREKRGSYRREREYRRSRR